MIFCFFTCPGFVLGFWGKIKLLVTYRVAILQMVLPKVLFTMLLNHLANISGKVAKKEGKEKLS
jgi:hypothetical protein